MDQDIVARTIGRRVRHARKSARLARKVLAVRADVSERYLHRLEAGEANASIGILVRVANVLGLALTDLVDMDADTGFEVADTPPRPAQRRTAADLMLHDLIDRLPPDERARLRSELANRLAERRRALKGIALLGLRGAGKSTLGRALAERDGYVFVSITSEIERSAGMDLAELFNLGGPEAYRNLENEVVARLISDGRRFVVETAGGIASNPAALEAVLAAFHGVWLRATPEEHLARVAAQGDQRPMAGNPRAHDDIRSLLERRTPEYARADDTLDTSGRSVEDCLDELRAIAARALGTGTI